MKILLVLILIFYSLNNLNAKNDSTGNRARMIGGDFIIGYPLYDIQILKTDFEKISKQINLPVKMVENYPVLPYYQGELFFTSKKDLSFGIRLSYITTGARLSYKDYSGEYNVDEIINNYQYGFFFTLPTFNLQNNMKSYFYGSAGLVSSSYKIIESTKLNEFGTVNNISVLDDISYYVEPGMRLIYYWEPFFIGANLTFNLNIAKVNHVEWSGLRTGLLFGINY